MVEMDYFNKARDLLHRFKGNSYIYGQSALSKTGSAASSIGKKAILVRGTFKSSDSYVEIIKNSLSESSVELIGQFKGARPNSPKEDLFRITEEIKNAGPDVVISFGGGSTIDATKAAIVLQSLNGKIDDYFGTNLVTQELEKNSQSLTPHIAIQTLAGSASHLTKYANVTDMSTAQKKLIVDDAVIPGLAIFDHEVTYNTPADITIDGAMDGIAHCLEVLYGSAGKPVYNMVEEIAEICISLIISYLPVALDNPKDREAHEALCLATDLGGYAIMTGGTNGGHLSSYSLVDILSHGRACAIMNPYYTVFFAPVIEKPLRLLSKIYEQAGLIKSSVENLKDRDLGVAVAEAMFEFAKKIGLPTRLDEINGFSEEHVERALTAAKNPQLKMKLQNMPIPLTAEMVDEYMQPVLEAAANGDISLIKNVLV